MKASHTAAIHPRTARASVDTGKGERVARASRRDAGRAGLGDVCAVLWPPPAGASVARNRTARADERDFIVLPHARSPRLLVPSVRRASAAAVRRYGEPGSLTAWVGARALAVALAGGAGSVGLGSRLRVRIPNGADTIEAHLRSVLGRDVLISTHLGASRANRKPVLQLLTANGKAAGFAKISVSPLTRELIRAEHDALEILATEDFSALSVPRILHYGQWQGHAVLILSPLPVWRRRRPLRSTQLTAAMAEVAAVGRQSRGPVTDGGYLTRLRSRLREVPAGADHAALCAALDVLGEAAAGAELRFGAWHGDWTGWNMACTADGLLVWDWERFTTGVPVGFDALHYHLQSAVIRHRQSPPAAAAACVGAAASILAPFGVPAAESRLIAVLYLADLSARYLADHQAEAGARLGLPGTWLIPAIKEAVTRL